MRFGELLVLALIVLSLNPVQMQWMALRMNGSGAGVYSDDTYHLYMLDKYPINGLIYGYSVFNIRGNYLVVIGSYYSVVIHELDGYSTVVNTSFTDYWIGVFRDYLIILSYGDGYEVVVYNVADDKVVLQHVLEVQSFLFTRPAGIGYFPENNSLDIWFEAIHIASTDHYLFHAVISLDNWSVYDYDPAPLSYNYYFNGGITYYSNSSIPQTLGYINTTVSIHTLDNTTFIETSTGNYSFAGKPILDPAVVSIDNTLLIPYTDPYGGVAVYGVGADYNLYLNITVSDLEGFYLAYDKLVAVYTSDNHTRLQFIDPYQGVIIRDISLDGYYHVVSFTMDMDGDDLPEPVIYDGYWFQLAYTGGSKAEIIQWSRLCIIRDSPLNTAMVSGKLYLSLLVLNGSAKFVETYVFADNYTLDETPPVITIYSPRNNTLYNPDVSIGIEAVDPDSRVYALETAIVDEYGSIIYMDRVFSNEYHASIHLGKGRYTLTVRAWNIDGYYTSERVYFIVSGSPIELLYPRNQSIVPARYDVILVSNGTYNISLDVNHTLTYNSILYNGYNSISIDTSSLEDKPYRLTITAYNGSLTIYNETLLLFKDSKSPIIQLEGIANGSVINNSVDFTLYVYDEHLDNASIVIDEEVYDIVDVSGTYSFSIPAYVLGSGEHLLVVEAFDEAGNRASATVYFNVSLAKEPVVEFNPYPPNNSFVEGIVSFNISVSGANYTYIMLNDTILYVFPGDGGWRRIVIDTRNYSDGVYVLTVNATGIGGYRILRFYWFIDNNPPRLNMYIYAYIVSGIHGAVRWHNGSFVPVYTFIGDRKEYFVVKTRDGYLINKLYVNISDPFLENASLYINNTLVEVFNRSGGYFLTPVVPREGFYYATLIAYDRVGHRSTYRILFGIDYTPPKLEILSPLNGSYISSGNITLRIRAWDNLSPTYAPGIIISTRRLNVSDPRMFYPMSVLSAPNNTVIEENISIHGEGVFYVYIVVFDRSLNYYIREVSFTVDRTPPVVRVNTSIIDGRVYLAIDASDNVSGVKTVRIIIDGEQVDEFNKSSMVYEKTLPPGKHVFTVEAIDLCGNMASYNFTLTIPSTTTPAPPIHDNTSTTSRESKTTPEEGGSGSNIWMIASIALLFSVIIIVVVYRRIHGGKLVAEEK